MLYLTDEFNGHLHAISITEQQVLVGVSAGHTHSMTEAGLTVDNGHTHEVVEVNIAPPEVEKKKDDEVIVECWTDYRRLKGLEDKSFNNAKLADKFKHGDQWNEADKQLLASQKRACLVINEIKPKLDVLSGYKRQNRTDIGYLPVEEGDAVMAEVFTALAKQILGQSNYPYEEILAFEDQIAVGRGNLEVVIDTSKNIQGDVLINAIKWTDVLYDEHSKMDADDANVVIVKRLVTLQYLKNMYPDKAKELDSNYFEILDHRKNSHVQHEEGQYEKNGEGAVYLFDPDIVDTERKRYLMISVQRKGYKRIPVAVNMLSDEYYDLNGATKKVLDAVGGLDGFDVVYRVDAEIEMMDIAGGVLLDRKRSPFSTFSVVPLYANKVDDEFYGKVYEAMDAQTELNKRHSQMIDIINKMASYGIGYDSEAFDSPKEENEFINNRMQPGFVGKFRPGFKDHIHEFEGVKFPNEVVNSAELNSQKISVIMNVYPEMLGGSDSANQSGIVFNQKIRNGMMGNEYLFDNLSLSKRKIGRLILEAIQLIYTPTRIVRIIDKIDKESLAMKKVFPEYDENQLVDYALRGGLLTPEQVQQGQIDPRALEQVKQQLYSTRLKDIEAMLGEIDAKKYDVVVTESDTSPTMMMNNYMILQDLFRNNPNAPIDVLIKLIPFLSEDIKKDMVAKITGEREAQRQESMMKQQTEIQKSQIAASSRNSGQGQ
jgi:hypothetical protein